MPSSITVGKPSATRGTWKTRYYGVASGQTFVKGDWLTFNSSGLLVLAASAGSVVDLDTGKIVGRAEAGAVDVLSLPAGRRLCPVAIPSGDGEFVVAVNHGTPASATIAETDMDAPPTYDLGNTTNGWCAMKGSASDKAVVLVERHPKFPFGEQHGWFWARLIENAKIYESAS